jgi:hypothetical protein
VCAGAFAVVFATSIAAYLPSGGLREFYDRTIGYQLSRPDVFSPWALHPGLHPAQTVVEVLAVGLVLALALVPKERSLAQVAALAAAVTIAIQLPALHWFYYYILWFLPFVLVAILARPQPEPAATPTPLAFPAERQPEADQTTPVLAGV